MSGVIEISVSERIEAPAQTVWGLIGDFNLVRRWVPSVEHSTRMGEGIGAERTLLISGGARIIERLDAHDDVQRITTYSYVAGPLPVKSCTTTLCVNADSDATCTVVWSSRIEPDGLPPEQLDRLYRELYRAGIANIRRAICGTG